jgi:hypothetical protein
MWAAEKLGITGGEAEAYSDALAMGTLAPQRYRARFGWIALDRHGQMQAVTTTKTLIWAQATPAGITCF